MKHIKDEKEGRTLNIIGIIVGTIVFISIFLTYPYDAGIKQILVLWLLSSFYVPTLIGVLGYAAGDKKMGRIVIIFGVFIIVFFNLSLASAVWFVLY